MKDQNQTSAGQSAVSTRGKGLAIVSIVCASIAFVTRMAVPIAILWSGIQTGFFGMIFILAWDGRALFVTLGGAVLGLVGAIFALFSRKRARAAGASTTPGTVGLLFSLYCIAVCLLEVVSCAVFPYL